MWAQSTYTAATCNRNDVSAVINGPTHTAVSGDIIVIPAGACTWTSRLSVTAGITITGSGTPNTGPSTFGAGTPTTIIIDNAGSNSSLIGVTGITLGQTFRVSLLDIEPLSASTALYSPIEVAGTCTSGGCPNVRVDNIIFGQTTHWNEAGNSSNADTMIRTDNVFGVLDHNTLPTGSSAVFYNVNHSAYLGVGGGGDNSWAQPDTFGGANNLYAENNSIYVGGVSVSDAEFAPVGGAVGGARQVGRFNQIISSNGFGNFAAHGLDTDGRPQGGRQIEVYGNSFTCISNGCNIIAGYRAGTGFTFGNTVINTGTGFFNNFAALVVYRAVYTTPSGWGACGGSSPYDINDGVTYYSGTNSGPSGSTTLTDAAQSWTASQFIPTGAPYSVYDVTQGWWAEIASNTSTTLTIQGSIPEQTNLFNNGDNYEILRATVCADQGGRGQGNYVSGIPPSPAAPLSQALDPIYEWNDSMSPVRLNANVSTDTRKTIANRDWYTDNSNGTPHAQTSPTSPFNGTSGVGFGALANRPTTCTAGPGGNAPGVGYFATDQGSWNHSGNNFGSGVLYVCTATNTWSLYYTPYTYPHPLTQGVSNTAPAAPTNLTATAH
jgi:hypothetical protein